MHLHAALRRVPARLVLELGEIEVASHLSIHPREQVLDFSVPDLDAAVAQVAELGGSIIHPGERWAICRDSEGNPFALAAGG
jgi:predicted enzyme related to lactoylglutathione lyase